MVLYIPWRTRLGSHLKRFTFYFPILKHSHGLHPLDATGKSVLQFNLSVWAQHISLPPKLDGSMTLVAIFPYITLVQENIPYIFNTIVKFLSPRFNSSDLDDI